MIYLSKGGARCRFGPYVDMVDSDHRAYVDPPLHVGLPDTEILNFAGIRSLDPPPKKKKKIKIFAVIFFLAHF